MFPPVLTKADFVERYNKGEFGNGSPSWLNVDDFIEYGCKFSKNKPVPGVYHLRNRSVLGETHYNLNWATLISKWCEKPNKSMHYASAMAPHDETILQGEVYRSERGLYLNYTLSKKPMRDALKEDNRHLVGLPAKLLLQSKLCWNSYEWLQCLFDRYEDHVVEFSTFECQWGTLPGYNTVFWEVRHSTKGY